MTQPPLRVGVAGAGVFGTYHAQKAAASARTELTGIFDASAERADKLAGQYGAAAFDDFDALLGAADAVVIALPASFHAEYAERAVKAGRHALVEKPLALDAATARRLADAAEAAGTVLQVGHQERFVAREMGVLGLPEHPLRLESVRAGPPAPGGRAQDVSVIWDLMIHDLDLATCLLGRDFSCTSASGRRTISANLDEAEAAFTFQPENGAAAQVALRASRAAEARERTMTLLFPSGRLHVDFLSRTMENDTPFDVRVDIRAALPDPLGAADEAFFAACLREADSPVPAIGTVAAVSMAEQAEAMALDGLAKRERGA